MTRFKPMHTYPFKGESCSVDSIDEDLALSDSSSICKDKIIGCQLTSLCLVITQKKKISLQSNVLV